MANNNQHKNSVHWVTDDLIENDPYFIKFRELLPEFNFEDLNDPLIARENIKLLASKSSIMEQVIQDKGGWLMPQKMYIKDPNYLTKASEYDPKLDKFIMSVPSAESLYTRFKFLVEGVYPALIEEILRKKDKVKIASFGSGTGLDVMEAIENFGDQVSADMYDIDPLAIKSGEETAIQKGLEDRVRFHKKNLAKIKENSYDLGILIGVICPLKDSLSERIMKSIKKNISEDGLFVVSSSSKKMESDIFGKFLREYFSGWYLQYRDNDKMNSLSKNSGYETLSVTSEPMDFHKILIAKNRNI